MGAEYSVAREQLPDFQVLSQQLPDIQTLSGQCEDVVGEVARRIVDFRDEVTGEIRDELHRLDICRQCGLVPDSITDHHVAIMGPLERSTMSPRDIASPETIAGQEHTERESDIQMQSGELECCALCLQTLSEKPLGVCTTAHGHRTCSHYFHFACLRKVQPCRCPVCRTDFESCAFLPDIIDDVVEWSRLVAVGEEVQPSKREVADALKSIVPMPGDKIDNLLLNNPAWTGAADPMSSESLEILADAVKSYLLQSAVTTDSVLSPVPYQHKAVLTCINGHQSNGKPGERCACGCVHAVRGDRVCRGPAWCGGSEDGGAGQLGTIIREDENREAVYVQWDRAKPGDVHCYGWPRDALRHEISHSSFEQVPPAIEQISENIEVASVTEGGQDHSLRSSSGVATCPVSQVQPRPSAELHQRCRIFPDRTRVRRWFDMCPPCECPGLSCRGNMPWNDTVSLHVGREGYVLKIDEKHHSVLVEMTGRCNCTVWYPIPAVMKVYDPDVVNRPRFTAGAAVECKIDGVYLPGVVTQVWFRQSGWGNRPSVPYAITLCNSSKIFAPRDHDDVVRVRSESLQDIPEEAR